MALPNFQIFLLGLPILGACYIGDGIRPAWIWMAGCKLNLILVVPSHSLLFCVLFNLTLSPHLPESDSVSLLKNISISIYCHTPCCAICFLCVHGKRFPGRGSLWDSPGFNFPLQPTEAQLSTQSPPDCSQSTRRWIFGTQFLGFLFCFVFYLQLSSYSNFDSFSCSTCLPRILPAPLHCACSVLGDLNQFSNSFDIKIRTFCQPCVSFWGLTFETKQNNLAKMDPADQDPLRHLRESWLVSVIRSYMKLPWNRELRELRGQGMLPS